MLSDLVPYVNNQPENHPNVFASQGLQTTSLPCYNPSENSLAFSTLLSALGAIPERSVVVLQTSSHNPTGCDPTLEQWQQLAEIFKRRNLCAFLDAAYLGFVTGDVYADAESIRIFVNMGIPLLLAATYGKAFGLYGERVGSLSVIAPDVDVARKVEKQMKLMARAETGAQPAFGARIVEMILCDRKLRSLWEEDVRGIANELTVRRGWLKTAMEQKGTALPGIGAGGWDFLETQTGIFS